MSKFENFTRLDRELSQEWAARGYNKPNDCYRNAVLALVQMQSEAWFIENPVLYVEGIAVIRSLGVPLEHGWLQFVSEDTVIDPTWADAEGEIAYFPFALYHINRVRRLLDKSSVLPFCFSVERPSQSIYQSTWKVVAEYLDWDLKIGGG